MTDDNGEIPRAARPSATPSSAIRAAATADTPNVAFAFTKLIVGDLERSASFYAEVCGLTERRRIGSAVGGRTITEIILGCDPGGPATLVLLAFHDSPHPLPGDSILGFETDDLVAFIDRALRAGGVLVDGARPLPELDMIFAFVRDNEGHLIEVIQRL